MMRLRLVVPTDLTERVLEILDDEAVSSLQVLRGASLKPAGDVVEANLSREGTDVIVAQLKSTGVHHDGAILLDPASTWISHPGRRADELVPGASADAVVWPSVVQQSFDDSELNWTYVTFMVLATLIAGVAIVLDSSILVIGAMVLGPEFGAVAATSLALVKWRPALLGLAQRTLWLGFAIGIATTAALTWVASWVGWVSPAELTQGRAATSFIYHPDHWSIVVAIIAGAAGVLALTSARTAGLSGVFISVTTIPASANIAMGLALQQWDEVWGSSVQLVVNIIGMVMAGAVTLLLQDRVWSSISRRRARLKERMSAATSQ